MRVHTPEVMTRSRVMAQDVDVSGIPKAVVTVKKKRKVKKMKVSMDFDHKRQTERAAKKNCPFKAGTAPVPIEKFLDHANETSINPWKPEGFQAAAKQGAANVATDLSIDFLKVIVRMAGVPVPTG
ncbi:MAG: uncharacterized protein KVP18_000335 [Porospora cf. gigantea A]|uniref:uncharacterized protein n=1 Tax=Porospora cf. gigantea A TaxID=2853593 RepID=UPI003559A70C|nr:MAG: hypothetical protein KVP18_000335 [Porospora cf. gigantea A]